MFYIFFIFKLIEKLFMVMLVVLLCEQLKLQAFQTNKKLKREPCLTKD